MYSPDANSNNSIRLAVANGQSNLAGASVNYWDLTPQQLGSPGGTNYDQPKVAASSNYLYIEATQYGATFGSVVMRFSLDSLAAAGTLNYPYVIPGLFSPGFTQGATNTMYFAAHVSTSTLRLFSWPESSTDVTYTDVSHTSYPENFPYSCPRTGGSSTSDWCQRRSFGGGWAHDDRISTGWVANGVIGFMWDASQGSGGLGTFNYPYEHVVRIGESTKTLINEPYLWNPSVAFSYPSVSVNARGDIAGTTLWGGGSTFENCGAFIWDSYSSPPAPWEFYGLEYSNSDPNDTLSGDYLATRKNGGNVYTWSGTCYALVGGGDNGNVHPYYLSFGRQQDNPSYPPQPSNPNPSDYAVLNRASDTTLSWSTNGTSCTIHILGGSIDINPSGNCSSLHLGQQYGGSYHWQVTAANANGSTPGPSWHLYVKPYGPTSLNASPASDTQINLSWTLSGDEPSNVDGYDIYANGAYVASVNQGTSSYPVTGLTCNTGYSFYVVATRQSVSSDPSNTANGTTNSCVNWLYLPLVIR